MELKEVFEPVLNFIKNFQKKDKEIASKQAAKDRLKLVLMQDRASVSPDFFEMMKKEIIDVIKKYIEIDEESLEVELTRGVEVGLEGPALYANIPIKNVKPVAPKSEKDGDEEVPQTIMTEKQAEEVAEKLLNHAEEIMNKAKNEEKVAEVLSENENVEVEDIAKNDEEIEEEKPKKQAEKKTTKTAKKSTSKASTKKSTTSKAKKETKK